MSCRGVYFALSPEQECRLLAARGDDAAVLEVIQEDIEADWDEDWLCETDKAWDAMHRCLTDGTLQAGNGTTPRSLAVLGGEQLYNGADYFVCYVRASSVPEVAQCLGAFTRQEFDQAYASLRETDYDVELAGDHDREYTWEYLVEVAQFFGKAAGAGRTVVFTVDQ